MNISKSCVGLFLLFSQLTFQAVQAAGPEQACPLIACRPLASVLSRCRCGQEVFERTQSGKHTPMFCCFDKREGTSKLQRQVCLETQNRQKQLADTFCPVDHLWGEEGIVVKYGLTDEVVIVVHPALVERLDMIRTELQRFSKYFKADESVGFNPRSISGYTGKNRLYSLHAYGIAIDFNWSSNPYCPAFPGSGACQGCETALESDMPKDLIRLMESAGFEWGGHWPVPDPMHFELKEELWPSVSCKHWKERSLSRYRWVKE